MKFKKLIKGKNLNLRKLEMKYKRDIYELRQDKDVTRFLPNKYQESLRKTEEYINNCDIKWGIKRTLSYVIDVGRIAGIIMLSKLDFKNKNCELGIWLGKEFWHKNISKEATYLLLDYAFNELNMERVFFSININNTPSVRFFEKIGAKKEGILRKARFVNGKFEDKLVYSILKEEFK